jgi:DNA-binding response OmpR family regulator
VLLDIRLPKIDGIEILKLLRQDYPQVKVIIITAYDMEYKTIIDSIGCDAFFIKPLLIDELTVKIKELLSDNKQPAGIKRQDTGAGVIKTSPTLIPEGMLPKARILIVSLRGLISNLLKDYFITEGSCGGVYEVIESGLNHPDIIRKFKPDIILLDVALVGILGEFGITMLKMPEPPKEVILFGDPAVKWEEAETLIERGTKFIEIPMDLHSQTYPIRESIQRLNNAVRNVCAKYRLFDKEAD